jgi:Tfp pilus assembly protein PilN
VRHRQQVRELVVVGVLLLAALGFGSALLALQIARQRQLAGRLDHVLEKIAPTARQIQEKSRSVQLVHSVLQQHRQLATALADIFRQTPASVVLEGLTFERSRREMSLKGSAASTQEVLGYIKTLERVEGIRGVDLKYSAQRSVAGTERTGFELVLRLSAAPALSQAGDA